MAQPEVIKDIEARVKKSGDTMTGLLKTNGSIENRGEARFSHPTYCPNIEDTAVGIGCAFKASRGHFNQMNVNEIYLPATATTNYESNKILFKSYSGENNGTYTGVSEIAQINTTGLKVGSSSIGINGYIEGTWLRTTSAGNDKTGDFAIIDDLGWIYKRTPAQVLSDIGAASKSHNHNSKYVKKSGDTMTGNLTAPTFIGSLNGNATSATICDYPKGFTGRGSGGWGVQTGTSITDWSDGAGGDIDFRKNCPSAGQTSIKVDGRFYQNEGTYMCLDTNNFSGYALPLSGGILNGTITMSGEYGFVGYMPRKIDGGGGWAYAPFRIIDAAKTVFANMGVYGGQNTLTYIYIGSENYDSSNNLKIFPNGTVTAKTVQGAVWNDYAEYRKAESIEPGRVVVESEDGEMKLSTERLQPGAEIISDTFGFAIGETDEYKTPIAATGRVLAYPNEDRYSYPLGCAVCSGPNGTVSQMTREEIREYPERIIGTVSEIPEYKTWGTGNVEVNGRIWIRIK